MKNGDPVGELLGAALGYGVGCGVGDWVGEALGAPVGDALGKPDGAFVGSAVGIASIPMPSSPSASSSMEKIRRSRIAPAKNSPVGSLLGAPSAKYDARCAAGTHAPRYPCAYVTPDAGAWPPAPCHAWRVSPSR